jgi:hypothetical protein
MDASLPKPYKNSLLKSLPDERQDELFEYYKKHTQQQTLDWLAGNGVKTSKTTLYAWRSWYLARKNWEQHESEVLQLMMFYKHRHPSLTKEAVAEMGEFLFNTWALRQKDVKTWSAAQQVQLKRESQAIDRKKMALELKKYKDQSEAARKTVNDTTLTPEERQARIRQILGTE